MHIAIDARELRTTSGRYVERLLHYLQQLESDHTYTILLKPEDMDYEIVDMELEEMEAQCNG